MRLPEGVSTSNESHEFTAFPIHASKDISNGVGSTFGVRVTHGTSRIDVNETQGVLGEGERASPIDLAVGKFVLLRRRTQKQCLGVVLNIHSSRTESQHGAAHGFDRYRARKSKEIAPAQTISILGLDRFQETASLV